MASTTDKMVEAFVVVAIGLALISAIPALVTAANLTGASAVLAGFITLFFVIALLVVVLRSVLNK